jgi:serine/threonine protein kinase
MRYKERGMFRFSVRAPSPLKKAFARKLIRVSNAIAEDVKNEVNVVNALREKGTHPNIIGILNHGWLVTAGKVYFIDMELADLTLTDYINYVFHNKPLEVTTPNVREFNAVFSPRECSELQRLQTTFEIVRQVAGGLEFLHNSGHVHRDLKPQNGKLGCIFSTKF